MEKKICLEKIIKRAKTCDFVRCCKMAQGYVYGYPVLQVKNDMLCLLLPFLKYKVTGKPDGTLVFPIRYSVTMELPEERFVGFSNYEFDERFSKVNFNKAIGTFRHDAIKDLNKKEYDAKRAELFTYYDKLANSLVSGTEFTKEDDDTLREMLQMLVEPSLLPIYKALDKDFYEKYLRDDEV